MLHYKSEQRNLTCDRRQMCISKVYSGEGGVAAFRAFPLETKIVIVVPISALLPKWRYIVCQRMYNFYTVFSRKIVAKAMKLSWTNRLCSLVLTPSVSKTPLLKSANDLNVAGVTGGRLTLPHLIEPFENGFVGTVEG